MGDTELGTEDDDVDVDLQASASVELRSRWVDEATEVGGAVLELHLGSEGRSG